MEDMKKNTSSKVARSGPCIVGGGGSHTDQRSMLPGAMVKLNEHLK